MSTLYEELIGSLYFGRALGHKQLIPFQIPNQNIFWNLDLLRVKVVKIDFYISFSKSKQLVIFINALI